jgi:predicted SAM-dependent methyltransferase
MKDIKGKIARRVPVVRKFVIQNQNLRVDRSILELEKGNLEADIRELKATTESPRNYLAQRYILGNGLEIGATYLPTKVPKDSNVQYVYEASKEELEERYPELKKLDMTPVHIVDNAEKLSKVKNNSQDFIIANHFMEHTLDPIGTVMNLSKKLRKDGVLYFAIPDKRYTFDSRRPLTPYEHLLEEHNHPSAEMKWQHFLEASELIDGRKGKDIEKHARELFDAKYSIHYHVWTRATLIEFFMRTIKDFDLPLEITSVLENNPESIFVLRKLR